MEQIENNYEKLRNETDNIETKILKLLEQKAHVLRLLDDQYTTMIAEMNLKETQMNVIEKKLRSLVTLFSEVRKNYDDYNPTTNEVTYLRERMRLINIYINNMNILLSAFKNDIDRYVEKENEYLNTNKNEVIEQVASPVEGSLFLF